MHQEKKYNLNWHTYSDHLREMLHEMMKSNEQTDVTLVCEDKKHYKAHKIVLSACSAVFKSIINDLPQNSSVIYLRGIQHQELESILEFMYLGVATFYQERMNEFLNVGKALEIKEISKDVEFDDVNVSNEEPETTESENDTVILGEPQTNIDKGIGTRRNTQRISDVPLQRNVERKFDCDQCSRSFTSKFNMVRHFKSVHDGVKYSCTKCDYQTGQEGHLTHHIRSKCLGQVCL